MVNKFGGDSIMAIWNVPINCPDHALLAIKAAVDAQQALRELQEKVRNLPKMEFGIGINTGNVVAGNMGSVDRLEYSVIGDAVNIAARLAGAAPGGGVWIGNETFNLVNGSVDAMPLAPLSLKGKQAKFQAYEVTGIRDRQPDDPVNVMD
jgi:class 3 adenylate cyclase